MDDVLEKPVASDLFATANHASGPQPQPAAAFNERLIHEVRKHPSLYNHSKRSFTDTVERAKIWDGIARAIDPSVTGDFAKKRWLQIRDRYRKELKQAIRHNFELPQRWCYFAQLSWLDPYLKDNLYESVHAVTNRSNGRMSHSPDAENKTSPDGMSTTNKHSPKLEDEEEDENNNGNYNSSSSTGSLLQLQSAEKFVKSMDSAFQPPNPTNWQLAPTANFTALEQLLASTFSNVAAAAMVAAAAAAQQQPPATNLTISPELKSAPPLITATEEKTESNSNKNSSSSGSSNNNQSSCSPRSSACCSSSPRSPMSGRSTTTAVSDDDEKFGARVARAKNDDSLSANCCGASTSSLSTSSLGTGKIAEKLGSIDAELARSDDDAFPSDKLRLLSWVQDEDMLFARMLGVRLKRVFDVRRKSEMKRRLLELLDEQDETVAEKGFPTETGGKRLCV